MHISSCESESEMMKESEVLVVVYYVSLMFVGE
jgi:hypothetical protein